MAAMIGMYGIKYIYKHMYMHVCHLLACVWLYVCVCK